MASKHPQVKVCGLTDPSTAVSCADLGVKAIGCVFYEKSPRFVSEALAREICSALPPSIHKVGVFVDHSFSEIMRRVAFCGLTAAQLHGNEPPELLKRLRSEGVLAIKALFAERTPGLNAAEDYRDGIFLVEQGKGSLPGGNAAEWDWGGLKEFSRNHPLILAGGLRPGNVAAAIALSQPDGVDVSTGVESSPGVKDLARVEAFMKAIADSPLTGKTARPVFSDGRGRTLPD